MGAARGNVLGEGSFAVLEQKLVSAQTNERHLIVQDDEQALLLVHLRKQLADALATTEKQGGELIEVRKVRCYPILAPLSQWHQWPGGPRGHYVVV